MGGSLNVTGESITISDVQPVRFNDAVLLFSGVILANQYDVHMFLSDFQYFPRL